MYEYRFHICSILLVFLMHMLIMLNFKIYSVHKVRQNATIKLQLHRFLPLKGRTNKIPAPDWRKIKAQLKRELLNRRRWDFPENNMFVPSVIACCVKPTLRRLSPPLDRHLQTLRRRRRKQYTAVWHDQVLSLIYLFPPNTYNIPSENSIKQPRNLNFLRSRKHLY